MRTAQSTIKAFFDHGPVAVFGVSRKPGKFGNVVYKHLREHGGAYIVHPEAREIGGETCYRDLESIPAKVGAAVLVIPPAQSENAVKDCLTYGIRHIWLQRGAESDTVIRYCEEHGVHPVHGECILMFAEPVRSVHKFHRTLCQWFGRLPDKD